MGKALNTYPSLTFSPPLESTITIAKPTCIPATPHLRWQATLERDDYDKLSGGKSQIHVWSNCAGGQWSATPFKRCMTWNVSKEGVDLSLFECNAETTGDQVPLEASIPIPSSMVEFTYRVVYASGRTDWLGTSETNGKFVVSNMEEDDCVRAENWIDEENGAAFSWTCVVRQSMVVARLGSGAKCNGWAFKQEGIEPSDISRFIGVTSESVAGPVVALALLPQTYRSACVVYPPVLYTVQHGTLSLEGNIVLLHPEEGKRPKLNAYPLPSTWKDHFPLKAALLDLPTSDFLGVSVTSHADICHLHFLPVTGAQSIITLNSSDITSLAPSSSVLLFDPSLHAIKFLPALSLTDRLRIAVGPVGGEIVVVSAYTMSASTSVAFLHDQGSIAELEAYAGYRSEHSPSSENLTSESSDWSAESIGSSPAAAFQMHPKGLSSMLPVFQLLVMYIFRHFWALLFSNVSQIPPGMRASERAMYPIPSSQNASTSPRLTFKVTGNSSLLVIGEDAPKLRILVGGKSLQTTPKDVGGGHWLIENTSELETDYRQHRIDILLYD